MNLRKKLIRLAHAKPVLREHILPLLKTAGPNLLKDFRLSQNYAPDSVYANDKETAVAYAEQLVQWVGGADGGYQSVFLLANPVSSINKNYVYERARGRRKKQPPKFIVVTSDYFARNKTVFDGYFKEEFRADFDIPTGGEYAYEFLPKLK